MEEQVLTQAKTDRRPLIVGLCGPPGAGKTTLFGDFEEHHEISRPLVESPIIMGKRNPFYIGEKVSHQEADEKIREVGNGDIHQGYSELLRIQLPEIMKKIKKHNMVILDAIRSKEQLRLLEEELGKKYGEDGYHLALVEIKAPLEQRMLRFIERQKKGEDTTHIVQQFHDKETRDWRLLSLLPWPDLVVYHSEPKIMARLRRKPMFKVIHPPDYYQNLSRNMGKLLEEMHQYMEDGSWNDKTGPKPAAFKSLDNRSLEEQSRIYAPKFEELGRRIMAKTGAAKYSKILNILAKSMNILKGEPVQPIEPQQGHGIYYFATRQITEMNVMKKFLEATLKKHVVEKLSGVDVLNLINIFFEVQDDVYAEKIKPTDFEEEFRNRAMEWIGKYDTGYPTKRRRRGSG